LRRLEVALANPAEETASPAEETASPAEETASPAEETAACAALCDAVKRCVEGAGVSRGEGRVCLCSWS
jgi:hypothetical protein